jgi:thymidylate synthase
MKQYHDLVQHVLDNGEMVTTRTGIRTLSTFGYQMRFDVSHEFPAITTKKLAWKSVVAELLWIIEGSTDERRLAELTFGKPRDQLIGKNTVWTANADHQGVQLGYENTDLVKELGPVYGAQWRNSNGVDQLRDVIDLIRKDPDSRRIIIEAWNPGDLAKMALPPCHKMVQFRVINGTLHAQLYQRSADIGLGIPFNIASYALLLNLIAWETGLQVGELVHTIGDAHIYENHIDALKEQLKRNPRPLPRLRVGENLNLRDVIEKGAMFDIQAAKLFELVDYDPYPAVKMDMAV